jgi:death on curing protein
MRLVNRGHYGEGDVTQLAAHLLLGIGRNHPFEQGNKRTALSAATIFLGFNGYAFLSHESGPPSCAPIIALTIDQSAPGNSTPVSR